jgi:hypothetical protein
VAANGLDRGDISRTDRRVAAVAHLGIPIYSVLLPLALSKTRSSRFAGSTPATHFPSRVDFLPCGS